MSGVPFLEMFPGCEMLRASCGGLDNALALQVLVNTAGSTMDIEARFPARPAPAELSHLAASLREQYGLSAVNITPRFPQEAAKGAAAAAGGEKLLFGRALKEPKCTDMGELTLESGTVTVRGEVFAVNNREIQKRGATVICFDMTDYTGSVRVSKFFDATADAAALSALKGIKAGQYLTVRGRVTFNKFDNDMVLEPLSVQLGKFTPRPDTAEE